MVRVRVMPWLIYCIMLIEVLTKIEVQDCVCVRRNARACVWACVRDPPICTILSAVSLRRRLMWNVNSE